MLIKILGVFDLVASFLLFAIAFGLNIPRGIIIFFIVILLLKGAFILTKSIASVFDLFGALVFLLSLFFALPKFIFFIPAVLILQKGFLSVIG